MSNAYNPSAYPSGNPGDAQHFLPGALVLLLEHSDAANQVDLDLLLQRVNQNGGKTKLRTASPLFQCPPARNNRAFSIVLADVDDDDEHPEALVPHLAALNDMAGARRGRSDEPTLQVASPNWFAGGAPPISWGGPGARPVPATDVAPGRHRFTLPELPIHHAQAQRGAGVDVVILDTVPSKPTLDHARTRWHADHALIESLLQPDGVQFLRAQTGALPPNDYWLAEHHYPMPDHGLFAAGVVQSIAPGASIRLVETLNEWGVGTMQHLLQVLYGFVDQRRTTPLVINCSLTINLPQAALRQALIEKNYKWSGVDAALTEIMSTPLERVCDVLRDQGVLLVAAAGNDTVNNRHYFTSSGPANTRYPAAFGSVLGVAALDRHQRPTTYSNSADAPQHDGVATFGGAANEHAALADHGMLGVYTANTFPDQSENTNGWAWWAGTSFAAPVVTGTLAALLGGDPDPEAAVATVKGIAQETGATAVGPILPVQQG